MKLTYDLSFRVEITNLVRVSPLFHFNRLYAIIVRVIRYYIWKYTNKNYHTLQDY